MTEQLKQKLKDSVTKELVGEYKKRYKGLNQRALSKKNPSLLSRLRYRLGADVLSEVVPKTQANPMSKEERREYNKTYYDTNREEILESKKERYDTDPEYRKTISKNTKKYRKNKRPVDQIAKKADSIDPYSKH